MSTNKVYAATATVDAAGSLDNIDGLLLSQGDIALVITNTLVYFYTLIESYPGVENAPLYIKPNTNDGDKRWKLVSLHDIATVRADLLAAIDVAVPIAVDAAVTTAVNDTIQASITDALDLVVAGITSDLQDTISQAVAADVAAALGTWLIKTSNYNAALLNKIYCNSTSTAFTVTLPANGTLTVGDSLKISSGPAASTNNITIAKNGSTIMGLNENMIISTNNITVELVYDGSTWRVV